MVSIFVVTHKEFEDIVLPNIEYQVIKVGKRIDNNV